MSKYCIGIDLGGTFIKFGLLDDKMKPSKTTQLPTPAGRDGVVSQMVAGAKQVMGEHKLSHDDVVGVGIGAPGPLRISDGVVVAMPNLPGMDNTPLRDLVSKGVGLPAVLENDANAAGYGEYLCGSGKGEGDMVLLTLGTGVGSGIIIGGKVIHGWHEMGAELGHMVVEPGGEPCPCGQHGCLERYASATNVAQRATRRVADGIPSSLKTVLEAKGSIDAKDICEHAKAGDALAKEIWDQAAYFLALGCVNICRILDPQTIVLGGGMAKAGDDLLRPLQRHFHALHWSLTKVLAHVKIAKLGNDAGVIGAAGVAWAAFGAAV